MPSILFIGTSAAVPSVLRGFSCIGLMNDEESVLLDCGDGSIRNLLRYGVDTTRISNILISHYHSDHLSGLTQLIETMGIRKRKSDLNIFGPPGLKEYVATVRKITNVASKRTFEVKMTELEPNQKFSFGNNRIETFPMDHTVPCIGYRIEFAGKIVSFTGDTQPTNSVIELARGADFLIHESTYLQRDLEKARLEKHSTASEAAEASAKAGAKKLVLTHVNDEREKPQEMLDESGKVFSNTIVASDGLRIEI